MAIEHMRKCSMSLIRETKVETITRYHYAHIGMAKIKNTKSWHGSGGTRSLLHSWWEYKIENPPLNTV